MSIYKKVIINEKLLADTRFNQPPGTYYGSMVFNAGRKFYCFFAGMFDDFTALFIELFSGGKHDIR